MFINSYLRPFSRTSVWRIVSPYEVRHMCHIERPIWGAQAVNYFMSSMAAIPIFSLLIYNQWNGNDEYLIVYRMMISCVDLNVKLRICILCIMLYTTIKMWWYQRRPTFDIFDLWTMHIWGIKSGHPYLPTFGTMAKHNNHTFTLLSFIFIFLVH